MATNESEIPSSDPGPPVRPAPPVQPERPAQPASAAQPARRRTKRFWHWKLICAEFIVATTGIGGFIILVPWIERLAGLGVGILGLWLLSREIRGLAINDRVFALPTGRRAWLPILPLGRRVKIKPASLRELTVMSPWYGFQVVEIRGGFRTELLLFQTRGQRLRFMSVVEEISPDVQMFRAAPPAPSPWED
jgi:hypothetical protein